MDLINSPIRRNIAKDRELYHQALGLSFFCKIRVLKSTKLIGRNSCWGCSYSWNEVLLSRLQHEIAMQRLCRRTEMALPKFLQIQVHINRSAATGVSLCARSQDGDCLVGVFALRSYFFRFAYGVLSAIKAVAGVSSLLTVSYNHTLRILGKAFQRVKSCKLNLCLVLELILKRFEKDAAKLI
jgi:hypothetical protein